MKLNWRDFYYLGITLVSNDNNIRKGDKPTDNQERLFRSQFGTSWFVCSDVWKMLETHKPNSKREPKHLLWCLMFLKVYANESTHSRLVGAAVKTFRKWVWSTLTEIADLKAMVVSTSAYLLVN